MIFLRNLLRAPLRTLMTVLGIAAGIELVARRASVEMHSLISRERMIEQRQYQDAIVLWESMRARHPYSLTALFDVPRYVEDLRERLQETSMLELGPGK